jgi:ATP-dependent helicase/nuclease subunit B
VPAQKRLIVSAAVSARIEAALDWLLALAPATEALILASSQNAADDLARRVVARRGSLFAVSRLTCNRLIGLLAAEYAARHGLAFANRLLAQAVAARAIHRLKDDPRLSWFGSVIDRPGFAKAAAATRVTISHHMIEADGLMHIDGAGPALAALFDQIEQEMRAAKLIDRAGIIDAAIAMLASEPGRGFAAMPLLLVDIAVDTPRDRDFIAALAAGSPLVLATVPAGDDRAENHLRDALDIASASVERRVEPDNAIALARLRNHLFADSAPQPAAIDDSVIVESAASEMQECVEIARRIQAEARRGVPFDRIAILPHAPERYAACLEEALDRAGIPAWFAQGAARPEPGGRAFLALLSCAAERYSARRFAEYLALAQTPEPGAAASGADARLDFVPADTEFMPATVENSPQDVAPDAIGANAIDSTPSAEIAPGDPSPAVEGAVRAPWRWEQSLIDAAVVGGRDRWRQRLDGLEAELRLKRGELDDDNARAAAIDRQLLDLAHLRATAVPIIGALAAMPRRGTWGEWLEHLRGLARLALRDNDEVMRVLAELQPMAPVGPITLDEVRIVLSDRMGRLPTRPPRRRYGRVFVAPPCDARGLEFDVVFAPGLAERMFPKKLTEDPLLPDAVRRRLSPLLPLQGDRVASERLALRLAAGAARIRAVFSYPRLDPEQARPRVPSFYALEILRAAEGRLPGFAELARRAAGEQNTRLGWPTPKDAAAAIDDIEFDLSVLERLVGADAKATTGAAHYLLDANPWLGRALRSRARRWLKRWTPADGLVHDRDGEIPAALARHQLAARSYSPTALQNFAACPFRFYLQAVLRLQPRDEIAAIEAIDPLTRGALFHEVQFETLTALRDAGRLPVTPDNLETSWVTLENALGEVAARYHDQLAPAIERVWLDGIDSIRADLREWMRLMAANASGFHPDRFELAFGLSDRAQADPASIADPVALAEGINLRGSIDLVERGLDGTLRVTDHKTGRVRAEKNVVIGGGHTLQPVLYALAAERILKETVAAGRLYYCTAAGGYEERVAPLDEPARAAVAEFARVLSGALKTGFLPAAPGPGECLYCDYKALCGPYEETRVDGKLKGPKVAEQLAALMKLREMP